MAHLRFHNLPTGNNMNRKATPTPKTAEAKKSTAKTSKTPSAKAKAKGRKASQRKPKQEVTHPGQDQATERPAYATRPVQLHECLGTCVIFLDSNPLGDSDPRFLDRLRTALETRHLELLVTTETEVFDLLLRPFCLDKPSAAEGTQAPAPVEPTTSSEPGSAAR
jgi:hypothetical protein